MKLQTQNTIIEVNAEAYTTIEKKKLEDVILMTTTTKTPETEEITAILDIKQTAKLLSALSSALSSTISRQILKAISYDDEVFHSWNTSDFKSEYYGKEARISFRCNGQVCNGRCEIIYNVDKDYYSVRTFNSNGKLQAETLSNLSIYDLESVCDRLIEMKDNWQTRGLLH